MYVTVKLGITKTKVTGGSQNYQAHRAESERCWCGGLCIFTGGLMDRATLIGNMQRVLET